MSVSLVGKIVIGLVVIFIIGVIMRVRELQKRSKEIEKTLDYSKMREWEEDKD